MPSCCTGVLAAACRQGKRTQHGKPHGVVSDDLALRGVQSNGKTPLGHNGLRPVINAARVGELALSTVLVEVPAAFAAFASAACYGCNPILTGRNHVVKRTHENLHISQRSGILTLRH
jgi:hypothetical protein